MFWYHPFIQLLSFFKNFINKEFKILATDVLLQNSKAFYEKSSSTVFEKKFIVLENVLSIFLHILYTWSIFRSREI